MPRGCGLREHLRPRLVAGGVADDRGIAHDLLDSRIRESTTLAEIARLLHAHPARLVRAFSAAFGIAPHQ
ncbi:helix-turn-helix transcriptional regulator [Saccharopolyspora indica]|uniref:helix-turn-helix transcriptional regulator n=1 Tax=Saccharopolyspora indica TaxID=1229659 RepID=UPI002FDBCD1D